jgi:hypothetical protein
MSQYGMDYVCGRHKRIDRWLAKQEAGKTGIVQPDDVMPVAREPIATEALLQAEDVDRDRLLPEYPLGMMTRGLASGNSTPST